MSPFALAGLLLTFRLAVAEDGAQGKMLMQTDIGKAILTADPESHAELFLEDPADPSLLLEEEEEEDSTEESRPTVLRSDGPGSAPILLACVTILLFAKFRDYATAKEFKEEEEEEEPAKMETLGASESEEKMPAFDGDTFGATALHCAASTGEKLRELLAAGADPNARDAWDETPLHMAARRGCAKSCVELLDAGVALDALNADDKTALVVAAEAGHRACCQELLERGGKIGLAEESLPPCLASLLFERLVMPKVREPDGLAES